MIDEGLFQRGLSLATMDNTLNKDLITEYFNRVPLPDGAVMIGARPETISMRLAQRTITKAPVQHHLETMDLSIQSSDLAYSVLARRGLNMISLINDENPSEIVRHIDAHFR